MSGNMNLSLYKTMYFDHIKAKLSEDLASHKHFFGDHTSKESDPAGFSAIKNAKDVPELFTAIFKSLKPTDEAIGTAEGRIHQFEIFVANKKNRHHWDEMD